MTRVMTQDTNKSFTIKDVSILLAEDDQAIAKMYDKYLTNLGARVHTAYEGRQVLEILNSEKIDVILLDLGMPGMDGFNTLDAVRKNVLSEKIPVIILSNSTESELGEAYRALSDAGISGMYPKYTLSLNELLPIIYKAVQKT